MYVILHHVFVNVYKNTYRYVFFYRPRRFTLKGPKQYYFTCKDMCLRYYKNSESTNEEPMEIINLRGCEVTPDVNISQQRYGIKLEVPAADGMTDYILRCATVSTDSLVNLI